MGVNRKLGISIIGCGIISEVQAEAIKRSANANLVSVYSRDSENARRIGEKFQVPWSTEYENILSDERIDLVSVCTPSGTHLDYGKRAAEAGKHVVVEKPIEVSLERGKQLIAACRANNVRLAVIYQSRFEPEILKMKRLIEAGSLGKIFLADAIVKWHRKQEYYESADWRGTLALDGGGVLINQAIHTIDLLLWMVGSVHSLSGYIGTLTHEGIECEDNAVATLRFQNGALGIIEGSTSVVPPMARRLAIHATKGSAILTGNKLVIEKKSELDPRLSNSSTTTTTGAQKGYSSEPHQRQFEAIVEAIHSGAETPVSGEEALQSLSIVLGIYESAKRQQQVYFDGSGIELGFAVH